MPCSVSSRACSALARSRRCRLLRRDPAPDLGRVWEGAGVLPLGARGQRVTAVGRFVPEAFLASTFAWGHREGERGDPHGWSHSHFVLTALSPYCTGTRGKLAEGQAVKNAHQWHVQNWEQHGFTSAPQGLLPPLRRQGSGRQGNLCPGCSLPDAAQGVLPVLYGSPPSLLPSKAPLLGSY